MSDNNYTQILKAGLLILEYFCKHKLHLANKNMPTI